MHEPHPNGVITNGVAVWIEERFREEGNESFWRLSIASLMKPAPPTEFPVVISHVSGGEIVRSGALTRRAAADKARETVVAALRSLGTRDASEEECRDILHTYIPDYWF